MCPLISLKSGVKLTIQNQFNELNIKKFYELTGEHLYNDWKVQETIQNIKKKEEVFENEIRRNEQQKLMLKKDIADRDNKIKELEAIIEDYENSTSWKLTKQLRKIGTIVKKQEGK